VPSSRASATSDDVEIVALQRHVPKHRSSPKAGRLVAGWLPGRWRRAGLHAACPEQIVAAPWLFAGVIGAGVRRPCSGRKDWQSTSAEMLVGLPIAARCGRSGVVVVQLIAAVFDAGVRAKTHDRDRPRAGERLARMRAAHKESSHRLDWFRWTRCAPRGGGSTIAGTHVRGWGPKCTDREVTKVDESTEGRWTFTIVQRSRTFDSRSRVLLRRPWAVGVGWRTFFCRAMMARPLPGFLLRAMPVHLSQGRGEVRQCQQA